MSRDESKKSLRVFNRNGSINVVSNRSKRSSLHDLYHLLLSIRWRSVFLLVTSLYLFINTLFGTAYFLGGESALQGIHAGSASERWLECFFFSVQTLATIGYGSISPNSLFAHLLVTVEALVGLVGLALVTGIVFSRFSRPTARVRFSNRALITRLDGKPCLIFRMANERLNQIVEAQVRVALARSETTHEGLRFREFYDLRLERERSLLFAMTWTIVHVIEPGSPLYGQSQKTLSDSDSELIISLTGTDETFSQTVHARFSYAADEIDWNLEFEDMVFREPDGALCVALDRIHATRPSSGKPVSELIE
jgi:inward rectifier potassium channel